MTTRRQYIRSTAVGAGIATLPAATAQNPGSSGQLVFVYDDGPITDYTKAFPVHQEEDAPACVGAVSNLVLHDEDSLSKTQLAEMENAGWEIMSHTVNHQALSPIEVTADVSAGDRTIQVKRDLHSWEPGNTILITDGDRKEKATVTGGGN